LIYKNYSFKKGEIFINDSIKWVKQKENTQTFLNDFSAGLKININPEINIYKKNDLVKEQDLNYYIFIGKYKTENKYYFQLNEKISGISDLPYFLACYDCSTSDLNIFNSADMNTHEKLLDSTITTIKKINKGKIYLTFADTIKKVKFYKKLD